MDIDLVKIYIKDLFVFEKTGHDYAHAIRVLKTADKIMEKEGGEKLTVELACLLHDVIDSKIQDSLNPNSEKFESFFDKLPVEKSIKENVLYIINNMSFSKMLSTKGDVNLTKELKIVSDADKIDSLGAMGVARTILYGSKVGNPIYDPNILPEVNLSEIEYKRKDRKTTILNHFDEKLLQLDKYLFTETAKKIAKPRLDFIKLFRDTFINEWNSNF